MQKIFVLMLLVFVIMVPLSPPSTHAQEPNLLPADLLFQALLLDGTGGSISALFRIDAKTLKVSVFYQSEDALDLIPLNWSSSGEHLAVLQWTAGPQELCILTREGILETCLDHAFNPYSNVYEGYYVRGDNFVAAWGPDDQSIFYVRDESDGINRRYNLVEANIETKEIKQTLYEYVEAENEWVADFYWHPTAQYVAVYRNPEYLYGDYARIVTEHEVVTIYLQTKQVYDITAQVPPEQGDTSFCPGFSPQGSFLTARTYLDERTPGLILVDPMGNMVRTLDHARLGQQNIQWIKCPAWQADEQAFYFLAGSYATGESNRAATLSIYRYDLTTDELVEYQALTAIFSESFRDTAMDPLVLSPSGDFLALPDTVHQFPAEIIVVPGNYIIQLNDPPSTYAFYLLWFPVFE